MRRLLKVVTEVAEWTDSGRLFQREGAQELTALAPVLVLILGTDRVIPQFDLSERDGRSGNQGSKVNRLFLMKRFVGQQADLEIDSIFYW